MNTFINNTLPSKIDASFLNTLEISNVIDSLDDLLEAYLTHILHMVDNVRQTEIQLFNAKNTLIPVAESRWTGPPNKRQPKVHSDSWLLDYPVMHTAKRVGQTQIRSIISIPLMDSGTIMGFLNIQLEKLYLVERNQLSQFYLMGLQLAANIKEIRLKRKIKEIREDLQIQTSTNNALLQQATSLSKELYAISAISTKINQSMDFDKTLQLCLTTIRKVFTASCILIYTQNAANSKIELVSSECDDDLGLGSLNKQYLKSIEKSYLKKILQSGKPFVKEQLLESLPRQEGTEKVIPFASLIGVALNSRETTIGAMILLYRFPENITRSGMRLFSGMANIMGMAIENKALYRQSIQKKNEIDFLFHSIVEFNKTLDLKATLRSVAEKGVEYCGVDSRVYLFSHIKTQVIITHYEKRNRGYAISSSIRKINKSGEMEKIYQELAGFINVKPLLIHSVTHSRKIGPAAKKWFKARNIYSLIAVPLKVGQKKLGMLLLVRYSGATSFDQHELQFGEALASAASLAIENAQAYSASQEMSYFLEKKISEKTSQIQKIEARQKIRVENRKDIIFQVNRQNRFVFVNKAMELLSGLPREILCHKDFSADRVVVTEERAYIRGLFRKILTKETAMVKDAEYHHISHKGDDHVISLTIFPEHDQHGRVLGVEGVGRDVTEKKRLEAELKKSKELALLGEFSSAVAHQMRNPLGNILMGTKRLERAMGLDGGKLGLAKDKIWSGAVAEIDQARIAEILMNLSQGVSNLNQVVSELLEYTKTLKLRPSSQQMEIIIRETVQTFADLLEQYNIKVCEHFEELLPAIPVDAVLIGQVFQNVIYNAIQAMPRGGELGLFANMSKRYPGQMLLSFRDSGMGIDPAEIERIFHPFYTTKTMGTGLGLSVAHRIVTAHGGVIQVCRNPCTHIIDNNNNIQQSGDHQKKAERGITVHIWLPAVTGNCTTITKPN